jgi:hypothetical protein
LVLFLMFLAYAASGPVLTLVRLRQRRATRTGLPEAEDETAETGKHDERPRKESTHS